MLSAAMATAPGDANEQAVCERRRQLSTGWVLPVYGYVETEQAVNSVASSITAYGVLSYTEAQHLVWEALYRWFESEEETVE